MFVTSRSFESAEQILCDKSFYTALRRHPGRCVVNSILSANRLNAARNQPEFLMPPIRQPSFADVLEDVALAPHEEFVEDEGPSAPVNQDWLFNIFVEAAEAVASPKRPDAYRENAGDIFQVPLFDATADEDRIAEELDLQAAKNLDDLARIRRSFARRNHPDKLHPRLAELATARMKTANMLIDRREHELKQRS
jgi:hypothetical protein